MSRTLLNVVMLTALSAGESMVKYWRPKEGISLGGGDTVWCHFGGGHQRAPVPRSFMSQCRQGFSEGQSGS